MPAHHPPKPVDDRADDDTLSSFGYQQQFARTLSGFESFAVGFSFISITTGIFSTFGFVLATGGPRGIWTWPVVIAGQLLVALVYGMLASKIPLSGYSYQWASRLANPKVGWWFGWISFSFLSIVTVAVDYGLTQTALFPLLDIDYTPTRAMVGTLVVILVQGALILASTRITTRLNNLAVGAEVLGMVGLTVLLGAAALFAGTGDFSNLGSSGVVPESQYYGWLGPFMLSALLGAYTIVGWEAASNLAEETHNPRQVVPRAMLRSIALSGAIGMAFLIALVVAMDDVAAVTDDSAPVAAIIGNALGGFLRAFMLILVCVAIFACGLVIMVTNSRLIYAMARDRRLPGHTLLTRVPRPTGGPLWATVLAVVISSAIVLGFNDNEAALANLLGAATLMPALLYAGTVLLYQFTKHRTPAHADDFRLGRWETPVVVGALVWLALLLAILVGPEEFRTAQYYALGTLAVGLVVFAYVSIREADALARPPAVRAEDVDGNLLGEPKGTSPRP